VPNRHRLPDSESGSAAPSHAIPCRGYTSQSFLTPRRPAGGGEHRKKVCNWSEFSTEAANRLSGDLCPFIRAALATDPALATDMARVWCVPRRLEKNENDRHSTLEDIREWAVTLEDIARIRAGKRDLEQALALHLEMLNVYEAPDDQDGFRHLEQTRMAEHVESLIDQTQASP
jgi:hypothetical protein